MSKPKVRYLELARIYQKYHTNFDRAYRRVVRRGHFVLGPELKQFERNFAQTIKSKWATGVANGTDAIELSLRALDISNHDEVITTPLTAMPTLMAIAASGASIRLADVYSSTGLINPKSIENSLSSRTRFIVPVHLYGQVCDMPAIMKLAQLKHLHVVEDCAQAHGAMLKRKSAGTWGDLAAWSFYPTKNLGAFGDAGAVSGQKSSLWHTITFLRNYGDRAVYNHVRIGRNSRLDELQAAFLQVRLAKLNQENRRRRQIAKFYFNRLKNRVSLLTQFSHDGSTESACHLFVIISPYNREKFRQNLLAKGVETLVHYPIPAHLQISFCYLKYRKGDFPQSEFLAKRVVSLPLNSYLLDSEIEFVCQKVIDLS